MRMKTMVIEKSTLLLCILTVVAALNLRMGLDPKLSKAFPRDFNKIPRGTDYGTPGSYDYELNKEVENRKVSFLEEDLYSTLREAVKNRDRPIFTTALIAGDAVILDALAKLDLLEQVPVIFVDTYTLFPESLMHIREVENHYGFKAKEFAALGCKDQSDYHLQYGRDYWTRDIDQYDMLCKVEPMTRALAEHDSDCWVNGRRRDHGAERAALPVWEGKKLNPLALWTFEDCWAYLRKYQVPYHPLHDVGFSSVGDMHSTKKVDADMWFQYGGERSGRFQNLMNKDGSKKTECGIHTEITSEGLKAKSNQEV